MLFDVAEDATGSDGGELLITTDQPKTRAVVDGELDCGVEGQGVGHASLVDEDQRRRSDPVAQSGSPPFRSDQASAGWSPNGTTASKKILARDEAPLSASTVLRELNDPAARLFLAVQRDPDDARADERQRAHTAHRRWRDDRQGPYKTTGQRLNGPVAPSR